MTVQWLVFLPLILPLGIISGALEGAKRTFQQAAEDIFSVKEDSRPIEY